MHVVVVIACMCVIGATSYSCQERCMSECGNDISCLPVCTDQICTYQQMLPPSIDPLIFNANVAMNLSWESDVRITGSDSPSKPVTSNLYFTLLSGSVYRYDEERNVSNIVYTIGDDLFLNSSSGLGLYDIAMDRDYNTNNFVYLYYAAKSYNESIAYYDVVEQHVADGFFLTYVKELKRIPRFDTSPRCSGGWMKMGLREWIITGPAWLTFSVGCTNVDSYDTSAIHELDPHYGNNEKLFSSISQKIISCDMSVFKSMLIYCIVEDDDGIRYLSKIKKGNHHNTNGSHDSLLDSTEFIYDEKFLVEFNTTDCPVTSVQIYSGRKMRAYKVHVFVSMSACYRSDIDEFQPAKILELHRDHGHGGRDVVRNLPYHSNDYYLINTHLLGADKHHSLYFSGESIKDGSFIISKLVPVK